MSGFRANINELAEFCQKQNIDLIIDAAQSAGIIPLYPEELKIAAVVASGWKWLGGILGTALLYTNPNFRKKISLIYSLLFPILENGHHFSPLFPISGWGPFGAVPGDFATGVDVTHFNISVEEKQNHQ